MMASTMIYSFAVALLLGFAALAVDGAVGRYGARRRWIWACALAGSFIVPIVTIAFAQRATTQTVVSARTTISSEQSGAGVVPSTSAVRPPTLAWPTRSDFDPLLAGLWLAASGGLLIAWATAAIRVHRQAKTWPSARVGDDLVWVTEEFGPAVFGYFRPRVVVPRAFFDQPTALQSIVLHHEQEHIRARDPLLLLLALVLVCLAPWNPALWWLLRRLRFAIEVDCDARVLRQGIEPEEYGETLLAMSQHSLSVPLGVVALTEPTSQLERRIQIMMTGRVRHHAALMGLLLSGAASLVVAATNLNAPTADTMQALRKPAVDVESPPPYIKTFEGLLNEKYPRLLTEKTAGTPVITALFNHDGTIERTDLDIFPGAPEEFAAAESQFERFGLTREAVGYLGVQGMQTRANTVLIVFSDRRDPTRPDRYTSPLFPDTEAVDRAIVERFFPTVFDRSVAASEGIWVLFDRDGTVLRTGRESFDAQQLRNLIETRYPGIKTADVTATPVVGRDSRPVKNAAGEELQLHSVWLAAGSPQPGA